MTWVETANAVWINYDNVTFFECISHEEKEDTCILYAHFTTDLRNCIVVEIIQSDKPRKVLRNFMEKLNRCHCGLLFYDEYGQIPKGKKDE